MWKDFHNEVLREKSEQRIRMGMCIFRYVYLFNYFKIYLHKYIFIEKYVSTYIKMLTVIFLQVIKLQFIFIFDLF